MIANALTTPRGVIPKRSEGSAAASVFMVFGGAKRYPGLRLLFCFAPPTSVRPVLHQPRVPGSLGDSAMKHSLTLHGRRLIDGFAQTAFAKADIDGDHLCIDVATILLECRLLNSLICQIHLCWRAPLISFREHFAGRLRDLRT
jgi:hypothetical protein